MDTKPAVSMVAVKGRRGWAAEAAAALDAEGFAGIYAPSLGGEQLSYCVTLAHVTGQCGFGTSIQPIYFRRAADLAATAAYLGEISGGRFRLGIGVSHQPVHRRLGLAAGRPLSDMRAYVADLRAAEAEVGPLPPIVLATLRDKMLDLALEVADGAVWANAARSHMAKQAARVPAVRRAEGFSLANMIPTVIGEDRAAAAAVNRRTMTGYVALPNYRSYWKEAGYPEEMEAVEKALAAGDRDAIPGLLSDRWLSDVTLYGTATEVRAGVEEWVAAGIDLPILVPSSTSGGQVRAVEELRAAFA